MRTRDVTGKESEWLAERFEENRPHLRAVAYRMLGSFAEADDAVQDTWLRASHTDAAEIANVRGWLTTIVARVALNMLRARRNHPETSLPDPVVVADDSAEPEAEALLGDSVGLALLVVLDTLAPPERLAFVLHDVFKLPFEEIAPMVDRSPEAARQLASRARRRVKGAGVAPDTDRRRQREVVDAFFKAARAGDFEGLVAVLHPDVVLRADFGQRRRDAPTVIRGVEEVIGQALTGASLPNTELIPIWVNGAAGVLVTVAGRPFTLMAFTVSAGRIVEIDGIVDARRVAALAAGVLRSVRQRTSEV